MEEYQIIKNVWFINPLSREYIFHNFVKQCCLCNNFICNFLVYSVHVFKLQILNVVCCNFGHFRFEQLYCYTKAHF
jgi:hypothetical protein